MCGRQPQTTEKTPHDALMITRGNIVTANIYFHLNQTVRLVQGYFNQEVILFYKDCNKCLYIWLIIFYAE